MSAGEAASSPATDSPSENLASPRRKPRISLLIATVCGVGYIPVAPGTFGSIVGVALALAVFQALAALSMTDVQIIDVGGIRVDFLLVIHGFVAVVFALIGTGVAGRSARYWQQKDPQRVVIDEVSGQHLALVLGSALPLWGSETSSWAPSRLGFITYESVLSWKYLLLGFILFRVFDIWKPFPARQAEQLPGGWGIMADDWVAGIYAAVGLWLVRAAGI